MIRRFITVVLYAVTLSQPLQAQQKESPLWNAPGAGNPFIPGYFADPTIRSLAIPIISMLPPTVRVMVMDRLRYG